MPRGADVSGARWMSTIRTDKRLALQLLEWHGGQWSGVYAVGSTMLAAAHRHLETCEIEPRYAAKAIRELRRLKADANFPECVSAQDERECNDLAERLEVMFDLDDASVRTLAV